MSSLAHAIVAALTAAAVVATATPRGVDVEQGPDAETSHGPADKPAPRTAGYQIWADALKPIFRELLGPPAATDLAPPPTGDPSAPRPMP
jgi:hypothetical protein